MATATKNNTERPIAPSGFRPNLRTIPNPNGGGDVAEYVTPDRSRVESGFYVTDRGLPWHVTLAQRLGQDPLMVGSDRKLTVGEAIVLAGLDWEAEKVPMYGQHDGEYIEVPDRYVIIRTDTKAVLGQGLSGNFKLVQNRDAFTFGDYLLDVPGAHVETAGSLFGGRAVFVSFEIPDEIHVAGDPSDYRLFLLVSNGHDGNHRLRVDVTVERVVCRNTLRIAKNRAIASWSIRHSSGLDGRVQQARSALGLMHRYVEQFTESASKLSGTTLAERQVDEIIAKLLPLTEKQQERVDKDPDAIGAMPQGKLRSLYFESPTMEGTRGTAYGVLNAVTEYADHFRDYRDGVLGSAAENRAESLMFNDGRYELKSRAWDLLLAASDPTPKRRR